MARQFAAEANGWALAKRGKQAKAIKIRETGDGVPVGTQRDLGVKYEPITAAKTTFHAWVAKAQRVNWGTNPPLVELFGLYLERLEREGKTTESTRTRFRRFELKWGSAITVMDISHELCRDYAKLLERDGLAPVTIWGDLNTLRSCVRWAYGSGIIDQPRQERCWNISKPPGRDRHLTPEEFWRWYDAAPSQHLKLFLLLALMTAQRHKAITELRWEHVDFDKGLIDFQAGMRGKKSVLDKGFQKHRAVVAMTKTLRASLLGAKAVARTPYVIEYNGRAVSRVQEGAMAARIAAGLGPEVTPHVLRHTAATWAADKLDVEKVASLTGHKDKRTLEGVYIHKSGAESLEAAEVVEATLGTKLRVVK